MTKTQKITYWIATGWLALGMLSTGIVQFIKVKEKVGVWKILGVVAILIPKFPLLKEWTYAGFFFAMSGALVSHLAVGDAAKEFFGPTLLLVLIVVSWYFRPLSRKMVASS